MLMKAASGYKGKSDQLVREILRQRHSVCQYCGSPKNLQVSHIISRRYSATRCDLDNVQLLCAKDHIYFTAWPREFSKWITESIGSEKYEQLRTKATEITKIDWEAEYARLQKIKQGGPGNSWMSI